MMEFRAFRVEKEGDTTSHSIVEQSVSDLPEGDLLIKVQYSSVNYKDAMSAKGVPGVTRQYPHTPGIDAAGIIIESTDTAFKAGDEVIVIGFKSDKKKVKEEQKTRKKKAKEGIVSRNRVFVMEFEGDVKASAVTGLREEVTAILSIAGEKDEVVIKAVKSVIFFLNLL